METVSVQFSTINQCLRAAINHNPRLPKGRLLLTFKRNTMTTTTHTSQRLLSRNYGTDNKTVSLSSPVILLILVALLFAFFLTASGQNGYARNTETEQRYQNIVTNGDAIRSVLQ